MISVTRLLSVVAFAFAVVPLTHAADAKTIAKEEAKAIQAQLEPGQIATSATGWSMKAKINGKDWSATAMRTPDSTGRIIGSRGEESISLPFHRSYLTTGKTTKFGDNRAVDLFLTDDVGIWGARIGEMTMTKVDQNGAEGTFFFTAIDRDTNKKVEVTGGTFRILFGKQ